MNFLVSRPSDVSYLDPVSNDDDDAAAIELRRLFLPELELVVDLAGEMDTRALRLGILAGGGAG